MENISLFDIVKLTLDVLLLPLIGMTWSIQGRISKLEGQLHYIHDIIDVLLERRSKNRE